MGLPPWATSESQVFALVTGTNSGLGFGICERMIDEFLASPSRPISSHLVLIISTRSTAKTLETIKLLRSYVRKASQKPAVTKKQTAAQAVGRVHILGVEVDLCDLRSVYNLADKLNNGTLSSPCDDSQSSSPGLKNIRIPRLDVIIFNAGVGGWTGINWFAATWYILTDMVQATTWPSYKLAQKGLLARQQKVVDGMDSAKQDVLGQVFCANVFGHYILGHELMPLICKTEGRDTANPRGRIVWISSVEPTDDALNLDDIQGLESDAPYESSKRVTDLLALSSELPSVASLSKSWFDVSTQKTLTKNKEATKASKSQTTATSALPPTLKPRMYVTHPGICATQIVPLHIALIMCQMLVFYLVRLLGSTWHTTSSYNGACAPVWVSLADQHEIDQIEGYEPETFDRDLDTDATAMAPKTKGKWGSSTIWTGKTSAVRTETDGWGWTGVVGESNAAEKKASIRRRRRGRPLADVTAEQRATFEEEGRAVWRALEGLRSKWETWVVG